MVIVKKMRAIVLATLALGLLLAMTAPALATYVVNPDKTVTISLEVANISTNVQLTYSSEATITVPMTNVGNVWSATIGPLKPNWYRYWFNVDGMRMHDPLNPDHYFSVYGRLCARAMGFESNSKLLFELSHGVA